MDTVKDHTKVIMSALGEEPYLFSQVSRMKLWMNFKRKKQNQTVDSINMCLHNCTAFLVLLPAYWSFWHISINNVGWNLSLSEINGNFAINNPEADVLAMRSNE